MNTRSEVTCSKSIHNRIFGITVRHLVYYIAILDSITNDVSVMTFHDMDVNRKYYNQWSRKYHYVSYFLEGGTRKILECSNHEKAEQKDGECNFGYL